MHIHTIAQGRPEDNQVEFLQGPHGIVNPPKHLVLNNIRRFTMEHIGAANGLTFQNIHKVITEGLIEGLTLSVSYYNYTGVSLLLI